MFRPVAMQRTELSLLKEHAAEAALLLADLACFDPEISEVSAADLPELPGESYRQIFAECRSRFDKILLTKLNRRHVDRNSRNGKSAFRPSNPV